MEDNEVVMTIGSRPTFLIRSHLSSHHIWAARHFSRLVAEIEDAHEVRLRFDIKQKAYVVSTILSALAFLETAINEVFQDAFDEHQSYIGNLGEESTLGILT